MQNNLDKINRAVLVDLIGIRSNTRAWGARLIARIDGRTIYRQKYALNGHHSTSDLPIHIGTGTIDLIDELKIFWPSGQETTLKNIPKDIRMSITEGQDDFKFVPF